MNFFHNSASGYEREKNVNNKNNTNKNILKNIISEYSLKRNIFNPSKKSPNIFLNKLQHRMDVYYSLVKSST